MNAVLQNLVDGEAERSGHAMTPDLAALLLTQDAYRLLLAYAECEEAKRASLRDGSSYEPVFTKHGWDGRDVYGFLDRLRKRALLAALARCGGA